MKNKIYDFICACCHWGGNEIELDVITRIDDNKVCCPICQSDDVSVLTEN